MQKSKRINNDFYNTLHEDWFTAKNHPIALLRAENRLRNPWIDKIVKSKQGENKNILDIGCGAGLLTSYLAKQGHTVTGVDLSSSSLELARKSAEGLHAEFVEANAENLPLQDNFFDIVCAMDLLEHVENPKKVIQEASRVLKPGGLFFFHTFNRNFLSYLLIIKGVEWFVKNAPPNMHVYSLFIKPEELRQMCKQEGLLVKNTQGLIPHFKTKAFLKMLLTKEIAEDFQFTFSKSLATGYVGFAEKTK